LDKSANGLASLRTSGNRLIPATTGRRQLTQIPYQSMEERAEIAVKDAVNNQSSENDNMSDNSEGI
jgi:hypothetical protein